MTWPVRGNADDLRVPLARITEAVGLAMVLAWVPVYAQVTPAIDLLPSDGQLSREAGFSDVVSVRELEDGRVLVADRQERRLALVDFAERRVITIGRHGEGPGEYATPGYLYAIGANATLMTDVASRRWFFLDGRDFTTTWSQQRPLPDLLGPALSGADRDGRFMGVAGFAFPPGAHGGRNEADSLHLLLVVPGDDGAMRGADTIARLGGRGRWGMKVTRDPLHVYVHDSPLSTEDQGLLFADGWVAVAYNAPYRVDWRHPSGRWQRGEDLPFVRQVIDRSEKCFSAMARGYDVGACDEAFLDRFPEFPALLPAFLPEALLATPAGHLMVARTPSAAMPDRRRYDIVNREGRLVGAMWLPLTQRIVGFGRSAVYTIEEDALGLQHLRRHPWR